MQARTDIDDLDVVVRHRGGRYLARIPQAGLYATAETLPAAIEALEIKKKNLLEELSAADALDEIGAPAPYVTSSRGDALTSLAVFSAKCAIVVLLLLVVVGFTRHAVETEIDRLQAPKIGGTMFWAQVEDGVARASDPANDMPAAKKQALLADLHVLVDRWRPFVREFGRLFSDSAASPAAAP